MTVDTGKTKRIVWPIALTPEQYARLQQMADEAQMTMASYVRHVLFGKRVK